MDQFLFTIKNIHGSESLSHLDPKKRNNLSTELKQESYLKTFKEPIKLWKPLHCLCRLCKTYINGVGLLQALN